MNKRLVIAIDGPVGSGKGTLAVALAKRLNAFYIYTGGMYRALAYECLRQKIDIHDELKVMNLLKKRTIDLRVEEYGTVVLVNGKEIFDELFLPEVTRVVPIVAAFPSVRQEMVRRQQKIIEGKSVVVEGRDSATDVAPDADLKIFLTADINTRARRRIGQFKKRGIDISFEEIVSEVQERDRLDSERQASPLRVVPDAYVLDTTNLTIEETVDKVMDELRKRGIA